jgi:hypothetical protein
LGLLGLALTFWQVWQAKSAAQASKEAAESTKDSIRIFDTIVDFSSVINVLEDIKRMHRQPNRHLLLERYSSARKMLITIKSAGMISGVDHHTVLQSAISSISLFEKELEKTKADPPVMDTPRYNALVSKNIDSLLGILLEIKQSRAGV